MNLVFQSILVSCFLLGSQVQALPIAEDFLSDFGELKRPIASKGLSMGEKQKILKRVKEHERVHRLTQLQDIKFKNSEILFHFDAPVEKSHLKVLYFDDRIELKFAQSGISHSRMTKIQKGSVEEVFAFQQVPKIVLARLKASGSALNLKERLSYHFHQNVLRVMLRPEFAKDLHLASKKSLEPMVEPPQVKRMQISQNFENEGESSVSQALESKNGDFQNPKSWDDFIAEQNLKAPKNQEHQSFEDRPSKLEAPLATIQEEALPLKSDSVFENKEKNHSNSNQATSFLFKIFLKAAFFIAAIAVSGILLQSLKKTKASDQSLMGKIKKWTGPMGGQEKWIKVLGKFYIEPKTSLVLTQINGQVLVLGVTPYSVICLTQLSEDFENCDEDLQNSSGFSGIYHAESRKPLFNGVGRPFTPSGPIGQEARERIKSRLEGLKPL